MNESIRELVEKAKGKDKEALNQIISRFKGTIKKFSNQLGYEEAETDLIIGLIETICKIKSSNLELKNDGAITNYIYNSIKNKKTELYRKYVKGINESLEINLEIIEDTSNYQVEDKLFIDDLLDLLTEIQKIILVEKFIKGYSDAEIASKLHISRQAVNTSKNKALKKLKRYLDKEKYILA
ncbi:RNA polymerase sigma factor [Tepidibacter mesophilus]|uniref:RNA polymerase sigma factor n=1 Tax=Tepidibacter mesophilus TaxID=655607 RepID=UPI000C07AB04|nr:sigma-70 family RNA polymerase sigma factor [Tepidibacter mesophilus]